MEIDFSERSRRLKNMTGHLELARDFPLLSEIKIDKELFGALLFYTKLYLCSSLKAAGVLRSFESESLLTDFYDEIMRLPNLTPNGVLVPKKDNFVEFNLLHHCVSMVFKSLGLDSFIDRIRLPAVPRVVDGKLDPVKDSRPYSSVKLHSDIWNGDPLREIVVFIPVLGSIEKTNIEFFEPDEKVMSRWIDILPDYGLGAELLSHSKKYDCVWRSGYIYLMDQFLLHRTIKTGGGIRISIEFHFMPNELVSSDAAGRDPSERIIKRQFANLATWYGLGDEYMFVARESFEETRAKIAAREFHKISSINDATNFSLVKIY